MKKLFTLTLLFGALYLLSPAELMAQEVTTEMTKEQKKAAKEEAKIKKAEAQLEKKREKLEKTNERYQKDLDNFQKKNADGKLSPTDVAKITKGLNKQVKAMEKLEKFLAEAG